MYSFCGDQGLFSQQCVHKFYPECISWAESQGFNIAGSKPAACYEGFVLTPDMPLCWCTSNWPAQCLATSIPAPPCPDLLAPKGLIQHLATPAQKVTSDYHPHHNSHFLLNSLQPLLLKLGSFTPNPSNFLSFHPFCFHSSQSCSSFVRGRTLETTHPGWIWMSSQLYILFRVTWATQPVRTINLTCLEFPWIL